MPKAENVVFGNGKIQFNKEVDAIPPTSKTSGNVTVNNAGQDGVPAHYDAQFYIESEFEEQGVRLRNGFYWSCVVPDSDENARYRAIEDAAARQVAPMLRAVADEIERLVAEFDARREGQKEQG